VTSALREPLLIRVKPKITQFEQTGSEDDQDRLAPAFLFQNGPFGHAVGLGRSRSLELFV
jgi:hypothetical protein